MIKPYIFKKHRQNRKPDKLTGLDINVKPEQSNEPEVLPAVQGVQPDSREEWRMAMALNQLKLDYQFQYGLEGGSRYGKSMRGGIVLDFYVYTVPPTPLLIHGEYWHQDSDEVRLLSSRVKNILAGQAREPVTIWASTITSISEARRIAQEKLL